MRALIRRLLRAIWRDPLARMGAGVLATIGVVALLAPVIMPFQPDEIHRREEGVLLLHGDAGWEPPVALAPSTLRAVAFASEDHLVAIGNGGLVFDAIAGDEVASLSMPVTSDLRDVAADPHTTVVVGSEGAVAVRRGGQWDVATLKTELHAVDLAPDGSALAVGAGGSAYRWEGGTWEPVATGTDSDLLGVDITADGTGFVVGAGGTLLSWDGLRLTPLLALGFRDLYDVAVGEESTLVVGQRGTILRGTGAIWTPMIAPDTFDLHAVRLLPDGGAIAVGDRGLVARLVGDRWEQEDPGYRNNLLGADTSSSGLIAAVGTDPVVDALSSPSTGHLFGTNELGQDLFSQTILGSRTALLVGTLAAFLVVFIGTNVGLIAGYFRGRVDAVLMRVVDLMYGLPFEPFALVLVVVFRPSLWIVILAIGLLVWRTNARVIRSQVLSLANRPFVKAARVAGASDWRILYVHIAPNILPLIFLQLAIAMAFAISAEATLSFLGLGPPEAFSWGTILFDARLSGAWRTAWWWTIPPGLFILITVLSVFFLARALEVFSNPRLQLGVTNAP